jgi:hypothetical protein
MSEIWPKKGHEKVLVGRPIWEKLEIQIQLLGSILEIEDLYSPTFL